jgi:hypothetical protein
MEASLETKAFREETVDCLLTGGQSRGQIILRGNPGLSLQWRPVSRPKHSARKPWIVSSLEASLEAKAFCEETLDCLFTGGQSRGQIILRGNPGLSLHWRPVSRPKHSARKPWIVSSLEASLEAEAFREETLDGPEIVQPHSLDIGKL